MQNNKNCELKLEKKNDKTATLTGENNSNRELKIVLMTLWQMSTERHVVISGYDAVNL